MTETRALLVMSALTIACAACGSPSPLPTSKTDAPPLEVSPRSSGAGGPCFVSLVRDQDGKPSAGQRCAPGLTCDYSNAVPDGAGRCVAESGTPTAPAPNPAIRAAPAPAAPATSPPPDKAALAFAAARRDYDEWNPRERDLGPNRQRRVAAEQALIAYYVANRMTVESAKHVVEAAYAIAKMKRAALDSGYRGWFKSTVAAWDSYKASAPRTDGRSEAQQSPYVDYAAEADFTLLDERISADYDAPARHTYGTTIEEIFGEVAIDPKTKLAVRGADGRTVLKRKGRYQLNAAEAEKWDLELEGITRKYESREWFPVAIERQGRLYDSLRSGLASAPLPATGPSGLDFWRKKLQLELEGADQVMIKRYAVAVALGEAYGAKDDRLKRARDRLGHYTDVVGDDVMERYVTSTPDLATRGAAKLTYKPRQYVQPP